jgi:flagellar hook protein FlgE
MAGENELSTLRLLVIALLLSVFIGCGSDSDTTTTTAVDTDDATLAIEGQGQFVVGNGATTYCTRLGDFTLDSAFNLVNGQGHRVYGWNDTDESGIVDPASDEEGYINLDRREDGAITNVLASATTPLSGPNLGDATINHVSVTPTTVYDNWRVECVNDQLGWFEVSGTRSGNVGTFPYDAPINDSRLGSFVVSVGPPAQARMTTSFVDGDGTNEILSFNNTSGTDYVLYFSSATTGVGVLVSMVGTNISVTVESDLDGNTISTFEDIRNAINAEGIPGISVAYFGSANQASNITTNLVVSVPNSMVTDFDLGDVAPQGVLAWTANDYGAGGNDFRVVLLNGGVGQNTTEVEVDGTIITIHLEADGFGNIVATADDVYQAFSSNNLANALVTMDDPNPIGYGALVLEPINHYLNGGSGASEGDYFTFTTTPAGSLAMENLHVESDGDIVAFFEDWPTTETVGKIALIPGGEESDMAGYQACPASWSPTVPGTDGLGTLTELAPLIAGAWVPRLLPRGSGLAL